MLNEFPLSDAKFRSSELSTQQEAFFTHQDEAFEFGKPLTPEKDKLFKPFNPVESSGV
jgi:hypothetical protein